MASDDLYFAFDENRLYNVFIKPRADGKFFASYYRGDDLVKEVCFSSLGQAKSDAREFLIGDGQLNWKRIGPYNHVYAA